LLITREAVSILRKGGLVVYPTDTVYGLGADARNEEAVERVFRVKGRSPGLSLPVLACDLAQVENCAVLTAGARALAAIYWPGALTLVLQRQPAFPGYICNGGPTVAIRIPDFWLALDLARQLGSPITGTSANLSGQPSALDHFEARRQLQGKVDLFLDYGRSPGVRESSIVDARGQDPIVLREGAIPAADIKGAWRLS
jgi:L-threonylcarbamoyladenylate synthase